MIAALLEGIMRTPGAAASRRSLAQGFLARGAIALGAAVAGAALVPNDTKAKQLCRKNGARCRKKGKRCKARYCRPAAQKLQAPFSIEAHWTSDHDHDTHLFVPHAAGSDDPFPYVDYGCTPGSSACETAYPFACVSQDAGGPGDEVTTVGQLLAGTYEYWIGVHYLAPAGDVAVRLRDAEGRVVRSWSSPASPSDQYRLGWHVFDLDGAAGTIASVDQLAVVGGDFPDGVREPSTDVCPY